MSVDALPNNINAVRVLTINTDTAGEKDQQQFLSIFPLIIEGVFKENVAHVFVIFFWNVKGDFFDTIFNSLEKHYKQPQFEKNWLLTASSSQAGKASDSERMIIIQNRNRFEASDSAAYEKCITRGTCSQSLLAKFLVTKSTAALPSQYLNFVGVEIARLQNVQLRSYTLSGNYKKEERDILLDSLKASYPTTANPNVDRDQLLNRTHQILFGKLNWRPGGRGIFLSDRQENNKYNYTETETNVFYKPGGDGWSLVDFRDTGIQPLVKRRSLLKFGRAYLVQIMSGVDLYFGYVPGVPSLSQSPVLNAFQTSTIEGHGVKEIQSNTPPPIPKRQSRSVTPQQTTLLPPPPSQRKPPPSLGNPPPPPPPPPKYIPPAAHAMITSMLADEEDDFE